MRTRQYKLRKKSFVCSLLKLSETPAYNATFGQCIGSYKIESMQRHGTSNSGLYVEVELTRASNRKNTITGQSITFGPWTAKNEKYTILQHAICNAIQVAAKGEFLNQVFE